MAALDGETLAALSNSFEEALPGSYQVDRSADERHGSWEWTGERRERALRRYVVLACTKLSVAESPGTVIADFWAAADYGRSYFRTQVGHAETLDGTVDGADALQESIARYVPMAAARADQLTRADLDATYPSRDMLHLDGQLASMSVTSQGPTPQRRDVEQEVVRVVRERPGISLMELESVLGIGRQRLTSVIRTLESQGILAEGRTGKPIDPSYHLPPGSASEQ